MPFKIVGLLAFVLLSSAKDNSCFKELLAAEELQHRPPDNDHVTRRDSDHVTWYIPQCDLVTGEWLPLQRDSKDWRWCVHPITGEVVSEKSDMLSSCEGCLMSRLVNLRDIRRAEEAGSTANNAYFPECEEENPEYYEKKQCWNGYFNACWCVDPVSGRATTFPTENEVDCEREFPTEQMTSPIFPPTWCQVIENLITHYNRVYPVVIQGYVETPPQIVTQQSSTEQIVTDQSSTEQIVTQESSSQQTVTKQSSTEQPGTQQSSSQQTVTQQSSSQQTVTQESSTEQPVTQQSHTRQKVTHQSHIRQAHQDISMDIQCGQDGNFVKEQCLESECWCVDTVSGHVQEEGCGGDASRETRDVPDLVARRETLDIPDLVEECWKERRAQLEAYYEFLLRGVILEHLTIPKCTSQGRWEELQCSNQTVREETLCWCVDKETGQQTTGASPTLRSCHSCWAHVLQAAKAGDKDFAACDETGRYYTPIQCNTQGECWCVDHVTGARLTEGSRVAEGSRVSGARLSEESHVTGEECETLDREYNVMWT